MTSNQQDDNLRKRIEVKLHKLKFGRRFVDREGFEFDESGWLENALVEHGRQNFCAIVAETNPTQNAAVIRADALDGDEPPWKAETCITIDRNPEQFAKVVAPLLHVSREVLLIDPHFQPFKADLRSVLRAIAREISPKTRFVYHFCSENCPGPKEQWIKDAEKWLVPLVPKDLKLELIEWPFRRFHNRFVLTDLGGMNFPHGLSDDENSEPIDEVTLLSDESYEKRWRMFDVDRKPKHVGYGQVSMVMKSSTGCRNKVCPARRERGMWETQKDT